MIYTNSFFSLVWRTRNTHYASLGKRDVRIEKYNPGLSVHFYTSVIVRCHLSRQEADLTWSRAGSLRALRIASSGCSKPQRRDWLHRQLLLSPQAHVDLEYVCWVSVTKLAHVWTGARHMSHGSQRSYASQVLKHLKLFRRHLGVVGRLLLLWALLVALVENSVDYICILSNFSASQGRYLPHGPPGKRASLKVGPVTKCMTKITKELGKKYWNFNPKADMGGLNKGMGHLYSMQIDRKRML